MFAAISNLTANGIKFNGQNYDDWIEYVKLNAGLLGLHYKKFTVYRQKLPMD